MLLIYIYIYIYILLYHYTNNGWKKYFENIMDNNLKNDFSFVSIKFIFILYVAILYFQI